MKHGAIFFLAIASAAVVHAGGWGKSGLWSDGRAEVAFYDSERAVDGKSRAFKEQLITMKETGDSKKTRWFKFNTIQKIELENYPRTYVTSVYADEDEARAVQRIVAVAQDWNGNTIATYAPGELELEKDDYFEDQLPLSLRALPFKDGVEKKIRVWTLPLGSTAAATAADALLAVADGDPVRCRAGSIPCWTVTVKHAGKIDTYWFEKKAPNILVKMETSDGRKRLLYGRSRWTFWDRRIPQPNVLK